MSDDKVQRKQTLAMMHRELELMTNDDLNRLGKMVKVVLKSRTVMASIAEEIDQD